MPPDVTEGRVVVVVGGRVVVVVGGTVVLVVVLVAPSPAVASVGTVVVVGLVASVVVVPLDVVGVEVGADFASAVAPGCSRATVTPMSAATPPERTTAERVKRRTRACALSRDSLEYWARLRLTARPGTVGATVRVR